MYLVAVSSFVKRLSFMPKVFVLDDGSLTQSDRQTIKSHIPAVQIASVLEISTGACPAGSCWERLLLINNLVQQSYVVQLDSDTLTLQGIPEVTESIRANRSFTLLGDGSHPEIESMESSCLRAQGNTSNQVQALCERSFCQLPESSKLKYLRGNAGFTGFARGSLTTSKIEEYSDLMRRVAGDKWNEWGSEQVTSNLLIANTEGATALPFPKYLSHWARPEIAYQDAAFIHFIGPHRFENHLYRKSAAKVMKSLARFDTSSIE